MTNAASLPIENSFSASCSKTYVEQLVRRSGSSFFWGMRRLEQDRRRAVYAVYAFCRDVDDIVDNDGLPEVKQGLLGLWRRTINDVYSGSAVHPIAKELIEPVKRFDLQEDDFLAVINGMETDANSSVRIVDSVALDIYCDQVASAVGRLCVKIFGLPSNDGRDFAHHLGRAMQLTNILRDIGEDAARDRMYVPIKFIDPDATIETPMQDLLTAPKFPEVCADLALQAQFHFDRARELSTNMRASNVRPAIMMLEVYQKTLRKLCKRGWTDLRGRVSPSKLEKLWIAFRFGILT